MTDRQLQLLCVIADFHQANGFPPSIREMCRAMKITSTNGLADKLKALEVKGMITRHRAVARSTVPTTLGLKWVAEKADRARRGLNF